jgi:hypothetical protein
MARGAGKLEGNLGEVLGVYRETMTGRVRGRSHEMRRAGSIGCSIVESFLGDNGTGWRDAVVSYTP